MIVKRKLKLGLPFGAGNEPDYYPGKDAGTGYAGTGRGKKKAPL